jgi:hypothetical protein
MTVVKSVCPKNKVIVAWSGDRHGCTCSYSGVRSCSTCIENGLYDIDKLLRVERAKKITKEDIKEAKRKKKKEEEYWSQSSGVVCNGKRLTLGEFVGRF